MKGKTQKKKWKNEWKDKIKDSKDRNTAEVRKE
jgi:hypothetical protein